MTGWVRVVGGVRRRPRILGVSAMLNPSITTRLSGRHPIVTLK